MAEWRNEAGRVQDWNGSYTLTYPQYLTAQGYERSIRTAVDDQTEELNSANREALLELGQALHESLSDGFAEVNSDLISIARGVDEVRDELSIGFRAVTSALYWGFGAVSSRLDLIYAEVSALVGLTNNPTVTWSNERFRLALDAQARNQFLDAVTYVQQAIEGFGSNPGLSTDWRYHYFLGDIYLGSFRNHAPSVVDAKKAEKAFLKSAACAELDNRLFAGRSLIRAGRAAMVQGRSQVALSHTAAGLALAPEHAQGLYQAARLGCVLKDADAATAHLARALPINSALALSALEEPDFAGFDGVIQGALETAEVRSRELYQERRTKVLDVLMEIESLPSHFAEARTSLLKATAAVRMELGKIDTVAEGDFADTEHARIELIGLEAALLQLPGQAQSLFCTHAEKAITDGLAVEQGKRKQIASLQSKINGLQNSATKDDRRASNGPDIAGVVLFWAYIGYIIFVDFPRFQQGFDDDSEAIGTILSWPLILWLISATAQWASREASKASAEDRTQKIGILQAEVAALDAGAREAEHEAYLLKEACSQAPQKFAVSFKAGDIARVGIITDLS